MATNMPSLRPRRVLFLAAFATSLFVLYHSLTTQESWRAPPLGKIGLGDMKLPAGNAIQDTKGEFSGSFDDQYSGNGDQYSGNGASSQGADSFESFHPSGGFQPGIAKDKGATYSKMLVIPRTMHENVTWITEAFNNSNSISTSIYVADDPSAPLHPPQNKGHEGMIYLTYIIDHYDNLSDISIFMHSHRYAWHNNDILDNDATQMITRLSAPHIQRAGYANLRCDWHPGCPSWLHPGAVHEDGNKKEEVEFARAWAEIFPGDAVPKVVAQTCCAQFAVSRDRVRALARRKYVLLREWLLRTPLRDSISGRVWEYLWQFVFTGEHVVCPLEHVCYCDGYGICFGGRDEYDKWWERMWERRHYDELLEAWRANATALEKAKDEGRADVVETLFVPEVGLDKELEGKIEALNLVLEEEKKKAIERGNDPRNRAQEAGRAWKEGDGF